ncbi:MAG: cupredoxin domain-containing protein [Chloroflexota bacterium]|nr:cupredoxin domain-containing protein [Chloroflexota bacterium]
MRIRTFPALAVALALASVACGGSNATRAPSESVAPGSQAPSSVAPGSQAPSGAAPGTDAPGAGTTQVSIVDRAFNPVAVNVSVGDEVVWTHAGDLPHTVTFDDGPDSGNMASGDTFPFTFEEAGEFSYVCEIHSDMQGTVNVSE